MNKIWIGMIVAVLGLSVCAQEPVNTVTVKESWCDIECPATVKMGEPFSMKVTMHDIADGMLAGCVVKAITNQGKEAGIVGRFPRIKNIENDHEYVITSTVNEGPGWMKTVSCFLTVSPDGKWENRVHEVATPVIQLERE